MARPTDAEGWGALRADVNEAFSPGAPIRTLTDLSGRIEQIQRLSDIMLRAGEHAIVFGERGVGKTSLSQTFHTGLNRPTRKVQEIHVNCHPDDSFTSLWKKVFRRMGVTVDGGRTTVDQLYPGEITSDDVEVELGNYSLNDLPIIILDEFDQVQDERTKSLITATIKSMSDHRVHSKIVLVGIAGDVADLVAQHASLSRNLKQVKMPRLDLVDLEGIVGPRLRRCGMSIEDDALFQIAFLARGLPYYCHLVGQYAALSAVDAKRTVVTEDDVLDGLTAAVQDVDQTITETYLKAVVSQRPEETLYEPVLVACALADADELGRFQQSSVTAPLAEIAPRQPPYTPTTFAFHMNEFCEEKRLKILEKSGEARNLRYRFSDPMMQPYVIIRALQSKRLQIETFKKFTALRQPSLPIAP